MPDGLMTANSDRNTGGSGPPPTRRGYDAREVVSALQKAIRRSEVDAALYWAVELAQSGYAAWCWKRLRVICSEDVGPVAPGVAADVRALYENAKDEKQLDASLYLAHAVIALAIAPKSRIACWGVIHHGSDHVERREIPDEALDRHTLRGRQMGRGWDHFIDEASRLVDFDGSLPAFEAEYRNQFIRSAANDSERPRNPWGQAPEPAHNAHSAPSGQLRLTGDDRR